MLIAAAGSVCSKYEGKECSATCVHMALSGVTRQNVHLLMFFPSERSVPSVPLQFIPYFHQSSQMMLQKKIKILLTQGILLKASSITIDRLDIIWGCANSGSVL